MRSNQHMEFFIGMYHCINCAIRALLTDRRLFHFVIAHIPHRLKPQSVLQISHKWVNINLLIFIVHLQYAVKVVTSQALITWSVVVDPRNVVHALSISLVNFIGDGTDFA